MRLYFIRDRYHQLTEEGCVKAAFLTTLDACREVVRGVEMVDRPRVLVQLLQLPAPQAEMATAITGILHGNIDLAMVTRTWGGTRRGGLQENSDDAPAPKQRKSRKVNTPAAGSQGPQETAEQYWARLNAGSKA